MEKARTGLQENRPGLGRRTLLLCKVPLPDRRLDYLSLKIEPQTRLGRSRRSRKKIWLEQRWIPGFRGAFAAQRSVHSAGEEEEPPFANRRITTSSAMISK